MSAAGELRPTPGDAGNLTQLEAAGRARRISQVSYELALELSGPAREGYRGRLVARFTVGPGPEPLWLDFSGRTLERLVLDGQALDPGVWEGHRIGLPAELGPGPHCLEAEYHNDFDRGGVGFHHFVDPEDGAVTIYTDFEPFNAHRLFPCFDQPDLKASYAVEVVAPQGWTVISSGPEAEAEVLDGDLVRHRFAPTPPFSTYLLAVIVGELAVWERRGEGVPLRLFARRSLAAAVDAEELLELTARGLAWYEETFACPFPFAKYDQVFVPEFNAGAMENVAAVTLGEHMILRGQASQGDRLDRAETLLHELAHMWFGNLVTMRWWDDLWLNESFATFVSHLALEAAPGFSGVWESFRAKIKDWAFRQDELATSHPVAGPVPDTAATLLNFDGITYGKGAAALKQLYAYVGPEAFRDGMRAYFARHAWGNTTLHDFLAALGEACGRDLTPWAARWIQTAGISRLEPRLEARDGVVTSFAVVQEPAPESGVALPHQLRVAFLGGDPPRTQHVQPVLLAGERVELPELAGRPLPRLVLLDEGDWTYAKLTLDPLTLDYVRAELEQLPDPLAKLQLWGALWQMVRDQRLGASEFLELAERRLARESRAAIVDAVLEHARVAFVLYLPEAWRDEAQDRLVAAAWEALEQSSDAELRLVWLRQLVGTARAPRDLARLVGLLDGQEPLAGVVLDQPLRWDLLVRLSAYAYPDAAERLTAERGRDPSDKGRKSALAAEAAAPDPEVKARLWEAFTQPARLSDDLLKAGMSRFHWPHQRELLRPFVERFFDEAPRVQARGNLELTQAFFRCLFPPYPEQEVLEAARRFLARARVPSLLRLTREALCELERAAACRRYELGLRERAPGAARC